MPLTCELIMLDRDTCGQPAEKCPQCEKAFCPACINEHSKVHQLASVEPKKIEVKLCMCRVCEIVGAYVKNRGCSACGSETDPLYGVLKPDGTILFYSEWK